MARSNEGNAKEDHRLRERLLVFSGISSAIALYMSRGRGLSPGPNTWTVSAANPR